MCTLRHHIRLVWNQGSAEYTKEGQPSWTTPELAALLGNRNTGPESILGSYGLTALSTPAMVECSLQP